jgi:hypothetical protein
MQPRQVELQRAQTRRWRSDRQLFANGMKMPPRAAFSTVMKSGSAFPPD